MVLVVPQVVSKVVSTAGLDFDEMLDTGGPPILAVYDDVVLTTASAFYMRHNYSLPPDKTVLVRDIDNRPVLCTLRGHSLMTAVMRMNVNYGAFALDVDDVMSYDGRLYAKTRRTIVEVTFREAGGKELAQTREVAHILGRSTTLYPGVAIQNLLGSVFVSYFPTPSTHMQVRIQELDGYRILDAKYDRGVLMVIGERGGQFDRLVFRFTDGSVYDLRTEHDVGATNLNFVTLDSGICVCMTEEEKLEVFSSRMSSTGMKIVEDTGLSGDMLLHKDGGTALISRGTKLFRMRMK